MFSTRSIRPIISVGSQVRHASKVLAQLDTSIMKLPMREAIRYTDKNMKFSAREFKNQIDKQANALIAWDYLPGETIAIWLHDCAERQVALLGAAKAGLRVVEIDDQINTVPGIRAALTAAGAKAIIFSPEIEDVSKNLLLLRKAIPEFFHYDDNFGQSFHSKHFPTLQKFYQIGFEDEMGCTLYNELFYATPKDLLTPRAEQFNDETPFYTKISKGEGDKVVVSPTYNRGQLLDLPQFYFLKNVIDHKYFEL